MKYRHMFLSSIAAGALALAVGACVHSDNGDSPADTTGDMMEKPEPVAVALPGNVPDGLSPKAKTMTIAAGSYDDNEGVRFSCTAGGDDCMVTVDADGMATATGGTATAALTPAAQQLVQAEADKGAAEGERDAERDRADELQAEKDREQAKMDLATAKALFSMLRLPPAVLGVSPETGGTTTATNPVAGRDGDGDGTEDGQAVIPALGKPDSEGMYSKKDGTTQWSAQVYSTKEADTTRLLAEVLAADSNYDGTRLDFASDPDADARIKSSSFPQESGTRDYPAGKREFSGTYMGAPGTYSCSGATCEATWTTTGIDLSSGWIFTPADNARAVVSDGSYQSYGWWLRKNADGSMDAGPVHFTTPATLAATGVTALEGSAKYKGAAAGKYAIYSGAFSERSEAGHFNADVMLEAEFGDERDLGTISGMIDGFMTGAGAKDDWSVSLNSVALTDTGPFTGGTTTWKIGTVTSDETGTYSGALYDSGMAGQDGVPYEAGGTFDVPFEGGVGEMVGAFAATRDTE